MLNGCLRLQSFQYSFSNENSGLQFLIIHIFLTTNFYHLRLLTTIIPKRSCSSVTSLMSAESAPVVVLCLLVTVFTVICVYGNGKKIIGGLKTK